MKANDFRTIVYALLRDGRKKDAARLLWPWFIQNEQTEKIWEELEKEPYLCIMGHGSASKTFTCTAWHLLDWWTWPEDTALIVTSDTIPSMQRRVWSDVKTLMSRTKVPMGGLLVDSKRMVLYSQVDHKNAIHGIAAESDDSQSKIQGLHTKRIRVLIDEADNKLSTSIWGAISNLGTSGDIKVTALANPADRTGEFARHCEPVNGWQSVNPEQDYEWKSRMGFKVIRLDGLKSPNIVAKKDIYPFLLTNKGLNDIREKKGENSPEWWAYVRAWYPPEGSIRNIFSTDILERCRTPIPWYTNTVNIAACDPAFEDGDNCIVVFGKMGRMAQDPKKTAVQADDFIRIKRRDMEKEKTYDFGDQIIAHLKARHVKPENFALDCTGNALGLSDYIKTTYGRGVLGVEFGGAPTDNKIIGEDSQKASERYKNFVTELWYGAREWCKLGHVYIPNAPRELVFQLESRLYDLIPSSQLIVVESKRKMKADRGLESPDYGDAFCILIYLARMRANGFMPSKMPRSQSDPMARFRKNQSRFNQTYGIKREAA